MSLKQIFFTGESPVIIGIPERCGTTVAIAGMRASGRVQSIHRLVANNMASRNEAHGDKNTLCENTLKTLSTLKNKTKNQQNSSSSCDQVSDACERVRKGRYGNKYRVAGAVIKLISRRYAENHRNEQRRLHDVLAYRIIIMRRLKGSHHGGCQWQILDPEAEPISHNPRFLEQVQWVRDNVPKCSISALRRIIHDLRERQMLTLSPVAQIDMRKLLALQHRRRVHIHKKTKLSIASTITAPPANVARVASGDEKARHAKLLAEVQHSKFWEVATASMSMRELLLLTSDDKKLAEFSKEIQAFEDLSLIRMLRGAHISLSEATRSCRLARALMEEHFGTRIVYLPCDLSFLMIDGAEGCAAEERIKRTYYKYFFYLVETYARIQFMTLRSDRFHEEVIEEICHAALDRHEMLCRMPQDLAIAAHIRFNATAKPCETLSMAALAAPPAYDGLHSFVPIVPPVLAEDILRPGVGPVSSTAPLHDAISTWNIFSQFPTFRRADRQKTALDVARQSVDHLTILPQKKEELKDKIAESKLLDEYNTILAAAKKKASKDALDVNLEIRSTKSHLAEAALMSADEYHQFCLAFDPNQTDLVETSEVRSSVVATWRNLKFEFKDDFASDARGVPVLDETDPWFNAGRIRTRITVGEMQVSMYDLRPTEIKNTHEGHRLRFFCVMQVEIKHHGWFYNKVKRMTKLVNLGAVNVLSLVVATHKTSNAERLQSALNNSCRINMPRGGVEHADTLWFLDLRNTKNSLSLNHLGADNVFSGTLLTSTALTGRTRLLIASLLFLSAVATYNGQCAFWIRRCQKLAAPFLYPLCPSLETQQVSSTHVQSVFAALHYLKMEQLYAILNASFTR
jgi:hypothetical protein